MLPLPERTSAAELGDWAELWCLVEDGRASRAELNKTLTEAFGSQGPSVDDVWMELQRRASLLGPAYPFEATPTAITMRPWSGEHLAYIALTLMAITSSYSYAKPVEWSTHARLFESLSVLALGGYVQGRALHIGWPRTGEAPADFKEMILFLRDELNEAGPGQGIFETIPNAKDAGVDVIAWKPFRDTRAGQLVVLGQCAVGRNWAEKLSDFNDRTWDRLLGCAVAPVRAFFTPFTGVDAARWDGVCLEGGIVFDRVRVAESIQAVFRGEFRRRLAKWCRECVATTRERLALEGWLD